MPSAIGLSATSTLHFVNLIVSTLLLVHLILRISPHHSHHLRCHHLSLPLPFTPDLKLISFTNPFLHSHSFHLRQLRPMLRSLTHEAARTLIQAFISSHLDYCNSLLYGVSDNLIRRVQSVQNAAARLLTGAGRRDHNLAGFAAVALAASSETR